MPSRYVWTAAGGTMSIELSDYANGYVVMQDGTAGFRAPSYEVQAQQYAGMDGSVLQGVRAEATTLSLGLHVSAEDPAAFRAKARGLIRAMRPKAGLGTLTVTDDVGAVRSLSCLYTAGLEGDEASSVIDPNRRWWRLMLKFYAPDPWWYGPDITTAWGLETPPAFFPLLPLKLGASTVQGTRMVDNAGDEDAFGRWSITGPGTGPIVLSNVTTGRSITMDTSLTAGRTLLVDTRPGFQTVTLDDGTNMFGSLTSDPSMWSLAPGLNEVSVAMGNATTDSQVLLTYAPRFPGIT